MASSVPTATASAVTKAANHTAAAPAVLAYPHSRCSRSRVFFPRKPGLRFSAKGLQSRLIRSPVVKAQLNEVVDESPTPAKSDAPVVEAKDVKSSNKPSPAALASEESISEFITQVASLVKLVDSRDIVELQMKQLDCELIIRKKEAMPQPPSAAPVVMMHSPPPAAVAPVGAPAAVPAPSAPASSAPTTVPSAPAAKSTNSSHPRLKSPMAGTFYRSPAPNEPPFVKVGDKVQKGKVLCIIEAMKLMNEIEADQSGTIVEILADDGKSVSIDTPLFAIEP
ncbi:biotin carboxyl carrier protein of acetyl-CoA carboxylase, chloroplastic isoform X2 [Vitis riparia]|uniref:biotin carboxyl carrier protein of acetyl-CoA carboxylase, chloroplastic isoform X2 n=1 Tax=Vitis riparia TaxID=96939 RepID=UPI00155AE004|nr:biotin carboxyl carrier protein of acetyl-CoA carboxylase, chloroplastic isoform X2 [Vitis riparia]